MKLLLSTDLYFGIMVIILLLQSHKSLSAGWIRAKRLSVFLCNIEYLLAHSKIYCILTHILVLISNLFLDIHSLKYITSPIGDIQKKVSSLHLVVISDLSVHFV